MEIADDVTKAAFHAVADNGVSHFLGHNKTHPGDLGWIFVVGSADVHDDRRCGCSCSAPKDGREIRRCFQSLSFGQHCLAVRPKARRGPCDDART